MSFYNLSTPYLNSKANAASTDWLEKKKEDYSPPDFPILLWDEKKIERYQELENRMPVAIAGGDKPQHIGSFALCNGKAETIASEVVKQAAEWGVGKEGKLPVMQLWDTTSTNSGFPTFPKRLMLISMTTTTTMT